MTSLVERFEPQASMVACRAIALEWDLPLREVYHELERILEDSDGR